MCPELKLVMLCPVSTFDLVKDRLSQVKGTLIECPLVSHPA